MHVLVIQNDPHSPAALVGNQLKASGARLTTVLPHDGGCLPENHRDYDASIILGGPMEATDDARYPAFRPMLDLLRSFHDAAKPMLGICLGAQLLARSFGAHVGRNPVFEFGFLPIEITPEGARDPLLQGLAPQQHILQWHEDTFALPEGGVRLMTGGTCTNQAFRYGTLTYGFQCHFEVSEEVTETWLDHFSASIVRRMGAAAGQAELQRVRDELAQHGAAARDFCAQATARWLDLIGARPMRAAV